MSEQKLKELPKGWIKTTLGIFSEITLGQSPSSEFYNEKKQGLPFYQGKLEFGKMYPTPRKWCSKPKKIAENGDVLISVRAPVGDTNVCQEQSCIGRGLASIRGLCGVDTFFILFLLKLLKPKIEQKGTGTTFSAISGNNLKSLEVNIPPLNEQKRIVSKIEELFSELDNAKDTLEKVKLQLGQYRQSLLKSAFEGKLTEGWRKKNKSQFSTGHEILEKIRKHTDFKVKKITELNLSDELYELPQEWMWAHIFDVSTVQTGPFGTQLHKSDYTKSGTPIIEIGDVHPNRNLSDGAAHFISNKKSEVLTRFTVQENDILFTRVGTVGRCTIVPKSCNGWLMSTSLIRVRPNELFNSKFLFFYFISPVAKYFSEKTSLGSTRKGTNSKIVGSLPLIILSDEEQKQIVSQIEQGFSLIENTQNIVNSTLQTLQTMKISVLKQAFEGRLVPQDDADEPAQKLLQRIKEQKQSKVKSRGKK